MPQLPMQKLAKALRQNGLIRFIEHFESKGEEDAAEAADPTADMEPEEALHWHILSGALTGRMA